VLLSPLVTHREESLYPDADRFVPERWLDGAEDSRPRGAFVPFGAGPHACIGEPFARAIMGIAMATIVPRWRLTLDGEQPPPVPRTPRPRFVLERR
jgi:pentalenene oxygenase